VGGEPAQSLERRGAANILSSAASSNSFGVEVVLLFRQSEKDISKSEASDLN
jgi:hypothetical protein